MDLYESPYCTMVKRVLKVCGLWPYQSNFKRRSNYVIFIISTFSLVFAMATGIYTQANAKLLIIIETYCALCYCGGSFFAYTLLYIRRVEIKNWYGGVVDGWIRLADASERKIMDNFLLEARHAILVIFGYGFPAFGIFVCFTFLPRIFRKESLEQSLQNFPCYFKSIIINENTCDLQISVHFTVTILFATSAYFSVSAIYLTSVKHVCGLYGIARYRLQHSVVYNKNLDSLRKLKDYSSVIPSLINVIDIHKDALRALQMIEKNFSLGFFFLEICALALLAVLMFEANYNRGNVNVLIRCLPLLFNFIMYVFFMNWCGEQVIQSCDDLRMSAYNIDWYGISSSRVRIFILMIMQKTAKPAHLTAGTVMLLSIQNFATILRTAWSFGMLLLTTQKQGRNNDTNFIGF